MNSAHEAKALGTRESSRSIMPPCPGKKVPMSFTPRSRLIALSAKSPPVAVIVRTKPAITPCHQGASRMKTNDSAPTKDCKITDPAKPSQDFFGLMDAAIGCLP